MEAVRQVLAKCGVAGSDVKGVGLSGQMHSSVFLDEACEVIRPAILWNDTRTSGQCQAIREALDPEMLFSEVCNPVLEGFTLPKGSGSGQ